MLNETIHHARNVVKTGTTGVQAFASINRGAALDVLTRAARSGVVVVRSTRLLAGPVLRNSEIDDHERGFVASDELNPAKSRRVQLQLALTQTADRVFIQKVFQQYRGESA